jgi:hypothetical protein
MRTPGRYVRSEQQSQRGLRAAARRGVIVKAGQTAQLTENMVQNCPPTLAPECEAISARAFSGRAVDLQNTALSVL